jgi:5,10-methylenetetrahydromethanopterin reductase
MTRLGISFSWRDKSLGDIVKCCQLAEEAGLDSAWMPETWGRDAFVALAAVANATKRINLATGIVNVYSRSPAAIAMAAATLDELSHGRTVLGLGSSGVGVVERWHGQRFDQPFARLRESVAIIRQILSGGKVNLQGKVFQVSDFRLAVKPPSRKVPIYVAALGPRMLRLAGELADGVLLYLCPPSRIQGAIAEIRKGAERARRSSADFDVAAFLPTVISPRGEEARLNVAKVIAYYVGGMGTYYHRAVSEAGFKTEADNIRAAWERGDRITATKEVSQRLVDSVALTGTPEECRTRLEEFRKAGLTLPVLSFSLEDESSIQTVSDAIKVLAAE